jgi:hypothetical protein
MTKLATAILIVVAVPVLAVVAAYVFFVGTFVLRH